MNKSFKQFMAEAVENEDLRDLKDFTGLAGSSGLHLDGAEVKYTTSKGFEAEISDAEVNATIDIEGHNVEIDRVLPGGFAGGIYLLGDKKIALLYARAQLDTNRVDVEEITNDVLGTDFDEEDDEHMDVYDSVERGLQYEGDVDRPFVIFFDGVNAMGVDVDDETIDKLVSRGKANKWVLKSEDELDL